MNFTTESVNQIIIMKNKKSTSRHNPSEHIPLVKWEEDHGKQSYNLLTIHSLLVDDNPKFIELKQIIHDYNVSTRQEVGRTRLKGEFISKLYAMMSQLTRIPIAENMVDYLNKIYHWVQKQRDYDEDDFKKVRPTTASTRSRPFSAYSRPASGKVVVPSIPSKQLNQQSEVIELNNKIKKIYKNVNYDKLKEGEKEFYAGIRTLHPQLQHPKKLLKQYQRKVFYEDGQQESQTEYIEEEQPEQKIDLPQVFIEPEIQEAEEEPQLEGEGQDINIDDIPIEGEQDIGGEGGQAAEQEDDVKKEVIDKLKPAVKAYQQIKPSINAKKQTEGEKYNFDKRNYDDRKVQEDEVFGQMQTQWANQKSRVKSQMKRRAESARICKNYQGIKMVPNKIQENYNKAQNVNIINFTDYEPKDVNVKGSRPLTAFTPASERYKKQLIGNAFLTGKLSSHVNLNQKLGAPAMSITCHAEKPKKKTFEQILQQAENKVKQQAQEEIIHVKNTFAKNKISVPTNKIYKSISFNTRELPEEEPFIGQITGMAMVKNPFIKVAAKKKKKKKGKK